MIPRALPGLFRAAVENGWVITVSPHPSVLFAFFTGPDGDQVEIQWHDGKTIASEINGTPTSYTQCTRMIRTNPEVATS